MVKEAYEAIEDADVILMMAEPFEPPAEKDKDFFEKLSHLNIPVILAINKIDLVEKDSLIPILSAYNQRFKFAEIVPISALKGTNLDLMLNLVVKYLPDGEPFFPEDYMTDYNERFFASEIIREKGLWSFMEKKSLILLPLRSKSLRNGRQARISSRPLSL